MIGSMLPPWWPPPVGAKLRRDGRTLEVIAVVVHAGMTTLMLGRWHMPEQRWVYEIADAVDAGLGRIALVVP